MTHDPHAMEIPTPDEKDTFRRKRRAIEDVLDIIECRSPFDRRLHHTLEALLIQVVHDFDISVADRQYARNLAIGAGRGARSAALPRWRD